MTEKRILAYTNGKFFTSDDSNLFADAMLVDSDGLILWIGKEPDMPAAAEKTVNLGGRRVLPGFTDAHMHPLMLADFSKQISALPPSVNSIADLIEKIKEVRKTQTAAQWICGWGYDEGKFAEHRPPTRWDLDQGAADAPVAIMRTCAHIISVNSKALALAGIDKTTPNPPGGEIDRDENGEPTGILKENARTLVYDIIPETTFEKSTDNLKDLGDLLLSQGITSITDMGSSDKRDPLDFYRRAAEKGFLQNVGVYYFWENYHDNPDFDLSPEAINDSGQFHAAGLKLIGDGSVSGHTAWVSEPYLGTEEYGINVCSDELLDSAVDFCKTHRCQLSMHAMGERAIDRIVNRISTEEKWTDDSLPHLRVEHITEPSKQAVQTSIEKGYAFVTQPIFLYSEIESYLTNLGSERTKTTYPIQTLLKKGVQLCLSTDAPATSWAVPSDPFSNLKAAVTRKAYDGTDCGQQERIDIETAIKLYTKASAEISGFKKRGQLQAGYHADFIVLDRDILTEAPENIDAIKVDATYINGKCVYERS